MVLGVAREDERPEERVAVLDEVLVGRERLAVALRRVAVDAPPGVVAVADGREEDVLGRREGCGLGVNGSYVQAHAATVRTALAEWRNPELLFRYLDDNRDDPRLYGLIVRWLRAIFGLSDETLRMIRRESPENVRHLLMIPQEVLLRWYAADCPGTSRCKTLFMLGEDALVPAPAPLVF